MRRFADEPEFTYVAYSKPCHFAHTASNSKTRGPCVSQGSPFSQSTSSAMSCSSIVFSARRYFSSTRSPVACTRTLLPLHEPGIRLAQRLLEGGLGAPAEVVKDARV